MLYKLHPELRFTKRYGVRSVQKDDVVKTICLRCKKVIEVDGETYMRFRKKGNHLCERCLAVIERVEWKGVM